MKKRIAQIVVGLPIEGPFDYSLGSSLQKKAVIGQRVKVSFNRRNRVGYIVGFKEKSDFKRLNPVIGILDKAPVLDKNALSLTERFAGHYGCSVGEAIEAYLPAPLRTYKTTAIEAPARKRPRKRSRVKLLHDIGCAKRWEKIAKEVRRQLHSKRSVAFIVPEKAYVDKAVKQLDEFAEFVKVAERNISSQKELDQWTAFRTQKPFVVIGTRRTVFAPLLDLGLIVIYDEEHAGYKQEQSPHYHVDAVAMMRRDIEKCDVLFVSSAPSAGIWRAAKTKEWTKNTCKGDLAKFQLVDMENYNPQRSSLISFPLQNDLFKVIEEGGRAVFFMNRRGFTTMTRCNQCGHTMRCPRCDVSLTYMYSRKKLVCRHCNHESDLPKICPSCSGNYLRSMGRGVEKLESEVARLFPQARVVHFDKDKSRIPTDANVIIATQAIMKMYDTFRAKVVAVLNFDAQFNQMDFRAGARAFALLVHLAQMAEDKLVVQARNSDNYCLQAAKTWDFNAFYKEELALRKELEYPPFAYLLALVIRGKNEASVLEQSQKLYEILTQNAAKKIDISEPTVDFMPKLRDQYRYTIMLKSRKLPGMIALARKSIKQMKKRGVIITMNVDP